MSTYTLFYASQDVTITPDGLALLDTWSVYSEVYRSIDAQVCIEGSTTHVSGNHTQAQAENIAAARQRASYSATRQENADG